MPSARDSSCGHAAVSVMSYGPEPSAYVELKNDGDAAAPVAVTLDGAPDMHAAFFAYASASPPTSVDEATACLTSSSGSYVAGGTVLGPELSSRNGTGLVVPAHGSAFVLLATDGRTGAYRLSVARE
jgi:hypothetical protein